MLTSVTLMAVQMHNISRAEVVSPYNIVELSISGGDVSRFKASCSSAGLSKSKDGTSRYDITLNVAEVLLRRGDLVHLSLRRSLIENLRETHTDINPQSMVPLPTNTQLQSLSINGECPVVAVFLSVVAASLQHLTLSLDFPSEKIFDQVSVLTTLVHISLNGSKLPSR